MILESQSARGRPVRAESRQPVIVQPGSHRGRLAGQIYLGLQGVDAVVLTTGDIERYRDTHCLVICPALREGWIVHAA